MDLLAATERLERVLTVRSDGDATADDVTDALRATKQLGSFLAAAEADFAGRLAAATPFPEATIADVSRESLGAASKTIDRSRTLEAVPALADALGDAAVTTGHVDAVTRCAKSLEPDQREELFDRVGQLVDVAADTTVEQFSRRVRTEANRIVADGGESRFERQQRATSMSTWTDDEGMWNLRGRFDPVSALSVSSALDRAIETLFAEAVPDSCPSDPFEKQKHLRALAFVRLVHGGSGSEPTGRPQFLGVLDLSGTDGSDSETLTSRRDSSHPSTVMPRVDWAVPVDVPVRVLAELVEGADVQTVVVRNGIVLHAPGCLDLGRSTRLANRAQRRALRAMYSSCAIPGCGVAYDRCKIHHVIWWRHGGTTDLANLLPVCVHHHHRIHDDAWVVTLGPDRQLTLTLPDGSVRNTGPPRCEWG